MIVKMKKITLLVRSKDKDLVLKKLRKLGVLHIKYIQQPVSDEIQFLESKLDNVDRALQIIGKQNEEKIGDEIQNAEKSIEQIISLFQ